MVRVITVHGTFAGDEADKGEKWWQKGSWFQNELQSLIADKLDFQPYHWSGDNSEMDRRRAGNQLARVIDGSPEPPLVIGHSHGGSAIIQALVVLLIRRGTAAKEQIRGFLSVGTPMFLFRGNRNPFSRFDVTGRLAMLIALGLLGLKLAEIVTGSYEGDRTIDSLWTGLFEFVASVQVGLAVLILALLAGFSLRNIRRGRILRANKAYEQFADQYVALNHQQDEAINGLISAKKIQPKLVKTQTVFITLFSTLSFTLITLFFAIQFLPLINLVPPEAVDRFYSSLEYRVLFPLAQLIDPMIEQATTMMFGDQNSVIIDDLLALFSVVPVFIFILLSAIVAFPTALMATPALSYFVANQLKSQSFGDDGYGETIAKVAPGMDFTQEKVGTLPAVVEQEMIQASVDDAGDAIQRIRELLSSGELLDTKGADLMAQSIKFERSELLHNAYFHSPLFARYMAAQLVGKFGLRPSRAFDQDPDAQAFLASIS